MEPVEHKQEWIDAIQQVRNRMEVEEPILNPENADPELCIKLLQHPSMQNFLRFKHKIKTATPQWMLSFLDQGGLEILFKTLDILSQNYTQTKKFSWNRSMELLQCTECVKAVMNSKTGLDHVVQHEEYTRKLSSALDTRNFMVKKQVFELLAALSIYADGGRRRALDAMKHYMKTKMLRHRFSIVVNELKEAENNPYQISILSFINAVIISTGNLSKRMQIRHEFISLDILDILKKLRNEDIEDLHIQIDVFEESKLEDDDYFGTLTGDKTINLDDHKAVFKAIYHKVCNNAQGGHFLNILQCFLQLESNDKEADLIWNAIDTFSQNVNVIRTEKELQQFTASEIKKATTLTNVPPTPPPPPIPGAPPPPPPPGDVPLPNAQRGDRSLNKTSTVPKPKVKLKKYNWKKIPSSLVSTKKGCVWSSIGSPGIETAEIKPDFQKIEELFAQKVFQGQDKAPTRVAEPSEITLIDGRRSLNINIFLKQFKLPNAEIISSIRSNKVSGPLTEERIKNLKKLYSDQHEAETLRSFTGDKSKLGNAEDFMLSLISIPSCTLRLDAMIMQRGFPEVYTTITTDLEKVLHACKAILNAKNFRDMLAFILKMGNFLNFGSYSGGADAFTLSSLLRLTETKSNKPRMTLLHYIVQEAEKDHPNLLKITDELDPVVKCQTVSIDGIKSSVTKLNTGLKNLGQKIEKAGDDLKEQFLPFLENSIREMTSVNDSVKEMNSCHSQLANYFVEEEDKFKLEDCIQTCFKFVVQVTTAVTENRDRVVQEEKRRKRQEQLEKQKIIKAQQNVTEIDYAPKSSLAIVQEQESGIVDKLLNDIRRGFKLHRISAVA